MDWKKALLICPEFWTGTALVVAGVSALVLGAHGVLAQALTPSGVGVMMSAVASKAAHKRAKVRVRRDDDRRR